MWLCYLLDNGFGKTYIGASNNFKRRIRQHNKEIKGGAKYTSAWGPWKPVLLVLGMPDKKTTLSLEWRMKRKLSPKTGKLVHCSSCHPRIKNVFAIVNGDKITSKSCSPRDIEKITLIINDQYKNYIDKLKLELKDNIEIKYMNEKELISNS